MVYAEVTNGRSLGLNKNIIPQVVGTTVAILAMPRRSGVQWLIGHPELPSVAPRQCKTRDYYCTCTS